MAKSRPRKRQPPTRPATAKPAAAPKRPPARPAATRTTTRRFPVFWVALGAVIVIAGIAAIVASAGGGGSDGGSGGATSGHEFGTVKVSGTPLPRLPDSGADPAIGETIPTVRGENFSGSPVTVTPDGSPQMIVFLAHWCPHCNVEAPKLAAYLKANRGAPPGVELTIVPTGSNAQSANWPPSRWVQDIGLGGVQALVDDQEGTAASAFGLDAYPFIVAVDKDGRVVDRRSGEQADGFFPAAFAALAKGGEYPG